MTPPQLHMSLESLVSAAALNNGFLLQLSAYIENPGKTAGIHSHIYGKMLVG
ncbi:hypothetical protein CBFG_05833 [Clostridiales bacterium 1_7_47FAA]|nr:hypothetical protein CBFG_05833 [Clostridiales bacterium 1_7_47FAA]